MNESKFTRGAWVSLVLVVFLFAVGIGSLLYFFILPTDGWFAVTAPEFDDGRTVLVENLLDAPSALQTGDIVSAIDGIPVANEDLSALQDRWRVGETLKYTVQRDGAQLDVPVTLGSWQVIPALRYWFMQSGGLGFLGMLIFLAIAALAFFKRPNEHAARALFLYAALFPALSAPIQISQTSPTTIAVPFLQILFVLMIFTAYSILFPPAILRLAMVFPRPKPVVQRHPWLEYLPYLLGLGVIPFFLSEIYIAGYLWTVVSIVGAIALVMHSALTARDALSRAQLGWGLWGFVVGMGMFLTNYLVTFNFVSGQFADFFNTIAGLSYSVLGITLAIAILRYRLFDIGILIRRTLTYTFVTIPLALIYFGSVVVLQRLFSSLTGSGQNEIVTVVSTLAIAALFIPVRNAIQNLIDKRFNRKKYDAQRVLSDFANTVRDETDLEKLTGRLMQVVDETMQPKSLSVWMKKTEDTTRTAAPK